MHSYLKICRRSLLVIVVCFTCTFISAQIKPKPVADKRTEFKLTELGISLKIDTTGWELGESSGSNLELFSKKGIPVKLSISQSYTGDIDELKRKYKNGEHAEIINSSYYVIAEKDSATIKKNNNSFWFKRISYRPKPVYWSEMNNKEKLNGTQMTAFLNSDAESWKKSENYLIYHATDRTTTGKIYIVKALYLNNGDEPKELEKELSDLVSAIKVSGTSTPLVSDKAVGWQEINYKQLGLRDIDFDLLMFTNRTDGFYILGGDADYNDDRLINLSNPSFPSKKVKKNERLVIDSSYLFFFDKMESMNWRRNNEALKLLNAARKATEPYLYYQNAFVVDSFFFWLDDLRRLRKINLNQKGQNAEIVFSPAMWENTMPEVLLLNNEIYFTYLENEYMSKANLDDPKFVEKKSVLVYNVRTASSKEYKQVIQWDHSLINYAGQPAFVFEGVVKIFNPFNGSFKQTPFPVKLPKGEYKDEILQQVNETIFIANRYSTNKAGDNELAEKYFYISTDACKTFKKINFKFKEEISQVRVYKNKLYVISRPDNGEMKVRVIKF